MGERVVFHVMVGEVFMQSYQTYTATHRNECRLIFGTVPLLEMAALLSSSQDGDVMDLHLASLTGAAMVTGQRERLDELLASDDLPISKGRTLDRDAALAANLSDEFSEWLYRGERGLSSDYIAHKVTGIPARADFAIPSDSADFRRCCGVIKSLRGMKSESDVLVIMSNDCERWSLLKDNWATLSDMLGKSNSQCSSFIGRVLREENRDD